MCGFIWRFVGVVHSTLARFPEVREEESERRSRAMDLLLLRFVRNVFLNDSAIDGENWFQDRSQNEVVICIMVNVLELLGTYCDAFAVKRKECYYQDEQQVGGWRRSHCHHTAITLPSHCHHTAISTKRLAVRRAPARDRSVCSRV